MENSTNDSRFPGLFPELMLTLRTKLLLLVLGVACSLVVALSVLSFEAIHQASNTAQKISTSALESQAHNHMVKVTQENAARNSLTLDRTMKAAALIAAATGEYFSQPGRFAAIGEIQGGTNLQQLSDGQHVQGPDESASIHLPSFVTISEEITTQIQVGRALDPLALGVLSNDPNAAAVYLITSTGISRYYSEQGTQGLDGLPGDFKATNELFFTGATPEANPQRKTQWTAVYDDPAGLGLMVSSISPVYTKTDKFIGVIGIDFRLSYLGAAIENATLAQGSYSFLIDNNARAIAFPDQAYLDILNRPRNEGEFGTDLSEISGEFGSLLSNMASGGQNVTSMSINGKNKFVAYVPMGEAGWSLATVVAGETILHDINSLEDNLTEHTSELMLTRLIPIALLVLLIVTSLAAFFAYQFTMPLRQLTSAAKAIGQRDWDVKMPAPGNDEVGILSVTLADMATQLKGLIGTLESRVEERTSELSNALINLESMTGLLEQQANYDELTGLRNRRAFSRALKELFAIKSKNVEAHLLYLDLDRFKIVNDSCGHAEGDRLLVEVSNLISNVVKSIGVVARVGGDEFSILIIGCNQKDAYQRAEQIREAVHNYEFFSAGEVFRIGVSIGLVSVDGSHQDIENPQILADSACYIAKNSGRNRVHVFSDEDSEAHEHKSEMRWVQRLRDAMDTDKFVLYGQKLQQLQSQDSSTHVEILLRLYDSDTKELIPPGAFLPAAERFDLLVEIDKWVVKNLISQMLANTSLSQLKYNFWVNLSGASLGDSEFCNFLVDQITQSNLPKGIINFEITETVVIKNMDNARKLIATLRDLGCGISLDDFGTGLSSLTYLRTLDVDYVKIDGSFVKGMVSDKVDRLFVKSTIEIAQHLGLHTVVEFVENNEIKDMATTLGADYAQGYGIHCPEELSAQLSTSYRRAS